MNQADVCRGTSHMLHCITRLSTIFCALVGGATMTIAITFAAVVGSELGSLREDVPSPEALAAMPTNLFWPGAATREGLGIRSVEVSGLGGPGLELMTTLTAGWPLQAFQARVHYTDSYHGTTMWRVHPMRNPTPSWEQGIRVPDRLRRHDPYCEHALERFPVRPIWSALMINIALWSAVSYAGLCMITPLHRRLRRTRGQCGWCGYPLRGARGPRCPECGKPNGRERNRARPQRGRGL